jgi:septal ring-binding cell division protein DamX
MNTTMNTETTTQPTRPSLKPVLTGLAALLLGACAAVTTAPTTRPVATARIQSWSAAYYGSTSTGKGTLNYNGRHHFTISSLGAGGIGAQKLSAHAKIYNLNSLSDFSGTYRGVSQGLTLIQGQMHAKLTNANGVVMYIAGDTEGLATSIGVQAFEVRLIN